MANWIHAGPVILAAFLASLVEFVEALTIVLAVGLVRGWRSALTGAAGALICLVAIVAIFGPLIGRIPLQRLQLVVGLLMLLFGMRWLRKAILRSAGIIPLHDEAAAFSAETEQLRRAAGKAEPRLDTVAVATSFKAVLLEGVEVVFIVLAIGAGPGLLLPASSGAALAFLIVVALGLVLHRPLATVPENALKFTVGILISAFGVFWLGEGFGFVWPGADWAIPGLILGFLLLAGILSGIARARVARIGPGKAWR